MSTETSNYKLKQWKSSDKPVMADFNDSNKKIDDALAALAENCAAMQEDLATLSEKVEANIIDAESSYSDGVFNLTTTQKKPEGRYTLRFAATADYTENDVLEIFGDVLSVVTTTNPSQPAPSGIFAAGAVISLDVEGSTAFCNVGGSTISPGTEAPIGTDVPRDVQEFEVKAALGTKITLTWHDPIDTMNSTWAGTRILRKKGSYPADEADGILAVDSKTRDEYASSGFVDSGLVSGVTYYYQAFPYSTTGAVNRNETNRVSAAPIGFEPIFSNNTWELIGKAAANNDVPDTWCVGDTKDITLSTNEVLTLQIYGKNHDDLADGSGKAPLTLGMKNLMAAKRWMNTEATNVGGFTGSNMYGWLQNTLFPSLPVDLQAVVKNVNKRTSAGNNSTTININAMKIFLFSEFECFGTTERTYSGEGSQYPIFTDNTSRIKYLSNSAGNASLWWGRSPLKNSTGWFSAVLANGANGQGQSNDNVSYGICFGFCI